MTKCTVLIICAGALALAAGTESVSAQAAGPDPEYARQRLGVLARQVADRSSPDAALRAYFQHLNNHGEIICLSSAIHAQANRGGTGEISDASDAIRDSFFTEFPIRVFRKYDRFDFAKCMNDRNSYSYEIMGVEPIGSAKTNITVVAKNTTPLRAGMKPSSYDTEKRREGQRYRFGFVRQGDAWKIEQIEEWSEYTGWSKEFKPEDLDDLVPSLVMIARHL